MLNIKSLLGRSFDKYSVAIELYNEGIERNLSIESINYINVINFYSLFREYTRSSSIKKKKERKYTTILSHQPNVSHISGINNDHPGKIEANE